MKEFPDEGCGAKLPSVVIVFAPLAIILCVSPTAPPEVISIVYPTHWSAVHDGLAPLTVIRLLTTDPTEPV